MYATTRVLPEPGRVKRFDVICAGETQWKLADGPARGGLRLRPGGGAVNVAFALAREGLRVGLATVLSDDGLGRESLEKIAAAGIDIGAVTLAAPGVRSPLLDATGRPRPASLAHGDEEALEVPGEWASQDPAPLGAVARGPARCGALQGRSSRATQRCARRRRLQREPARVVGARPADGPDGAPRGRRRAVQLLRPRRARMDVATARAALRESAVSIVTDGRGGAMATGPFGEAHVVARGPAAPRPQGAGDAFNSRDSQ